MEADRRRLDFLTNEPVDGELLADRLARGPLTAAEALRFAIETGGILNRAHSQGKVHGALSPHFVAITGTSARVLSPPAVPDERCAAYRSPEQVRGEPVDSRSDVFAYGAVLYEMATGRRAFPGEGEDLTRAILEIEPPAPSGKSPAYIVMEPVIAACLRKQPGGRRQRIQNAVTELRFAGRGQPESKRAPGKTAARAAAIKAAKDQTGPKVWMPPSLSSRNGGSHRTVWIVGISVFAIAATAVGAILLWHSHDVPPSYAFRVEPPQNTTYPGTPAISPDGSHLTFSAVGPEGVRMLWLRPLDALRNTPVPGTEGASSPFWSPDGKYIGFFANNLLKKVAIDGGSFSWQS